jgi:uncharacterized protein (DUF1697 family)
MASEGDRVKTYIALLRGINVVGNNLLPMKELVALLGELGCRSVRTYIRSGNVVFQSKEDHVSLLPSRISAEIRKRRGFEPLILLLTVEDLERALAANPFPEAEPAPKSLHIYFTASVPLSPNLEALEKIRKESERFVLKGGVIYLYAPEGIGRSKLAANAERHLGVLMTGRNLRTVCKIMAMAKEDN